MKNLAIIPARSGSKRLPQKNIIKLAGKPLIYYTINAAKESGIFNKIVVSTENEEIGVVAKKYGVEVLKRSPKLATDKTRVIDVFIHVVEELEKNGEKYDNVCLLLPTAPLRTSTDIKKAFRKFLNSDADALMCVMRFSPSPFWTLIEENGFLRPLWKKESMIKTQEQRETFVDNGAMYIFKPDVLKREKTYYCEKLIGYTMSREHSIDVDEEIDLKIAEFLLKKCNKEA